jgi:hypothetical protein
MSYTRYRKVSCPTGFPGAKPGILRMRLLEDNLPEKMLNGDIGEGSSCIMDVNAAGEITVLTGDGVTLNAGQVRGETGIA